MLILQSNCSPELPLETMHYFLSISEELQVISFAEDFEKLNKLIGEECEHRVIPVLLNIQSNDDTAKDMFSALPFVDHVINFDGQDFEELVEFINKTYRPQIINVTSDNKKKILGSVVEKMNKAGTVGLLFNMTTDKENVRVGTSFTRFLRSQSFRRSSRALDPRSMSETRNMLFKKNQEISKTLKEFYKSKRTEMKTNYNIEVARINEEDRRSREQIEEDFRKRSSIESQRIPISSHKAKLKQKMEETATRVREEQKKEVAVKFHEALKELEEYRKRKEKESYPIVCREVVEILNNVQ